MNSNQIDWLYPAILSSEVWLSIIHIPNVGAGIT